MCYLNDEKTRVFFISGLFSQARRKENGIFPLWVQKTDSNERKWKHPIADKTRGFERVKIKEKSYVITCAIKYKKATALGKRDRPK